MRLRTHWFWLVVAALIIALIIAIASGAKGEVNAVLFFGVVAAAVIGALRGKRL